MTSMKIAVGADHAGFAAKQQLIKFLSKAGYTPLDCGTDSTESVDYPDFAARVGKAVVSKRCDRGILICGSGIGMSIAANKIRGIRAALVWNTRVAKLAAQHNWTNILCLPARFSTADQMKKMVQVWLNTPYELGGRHARRVNKIIKFEAKS